MRTTISYKVVYFDGEYISEMDFNDEQEARNFAATKANSKIYKIQILGEITQI